MDDAIGVEVLGSFHDLFEVLFGLVFGEFMFFFKVVVEIPIFAEFSNNIHVIGGLVDVVEFNDVVVVDHFHDINLGLNIFEVVGIEEDFLINDFDGHISPSFNGLAQIHGSVRPLPDKLF